MKYHDMKCCTSKCRSNQHALQLIGLLTKTNDVHVLLSGLMQCCNCHKIQDAFGRSLLHMAASCGRAEVCEWLLRLRRADMNMKTFENGWTPAHCAAFYGQIDALITLVKLGANLFKNDFDRLSPLDHLNNDKWLEFKYEPDFNDDLDVYCWGSNENFNLGKGNDMKNPNAELLEFFKKTNTNIIDIRMSKFHTVFLSKSGEVYTCGFGIDGRLGHNDELTLVSPKLVDDLKQEKVTQICASRNNTYFLTAHGEVYSCGTNEFKQLGQLAASKSLSPKPISLGKRLKGSRIKQIECSRFHCVLLTSSNQVHTLGLNAGQLGHPNEMVANAASYNKKICYIDEPRLVTALNEPDLEISMVQCSDGCTIALNKSHLYLFNDYKSKRMHYVKETGSEFRKIRVLGGKLDNCANPDLKWIDGLNQKIIIIGLTVDNLLFVWHEQDPIWRNIIWAGNKSLKVSDFGLNNQGIVLSTLQGTCYTAEFSRLKTQQRTQANISNTLCNNNSPPHAQKPGLSKSSNNFNVDLKVVIYELTQVPFVNRCFKVFCDLKARNFFALQYHPNTNMRNYPVVEESSQFSLNMSSFFRENVKIKQQNAGFDSMNRYENNFSDIQLKYHGTTFYIHKFVLFTRCAKLTTKFGVKLAESQIDLEKLVGQKFSPKTMELVVYYLYTNDLEENLVRQALKSSKVSSEQSFIKYLNEFRELGADKLGLEELKPLLDQSSYVKSLRELHLNNHKQNSLDLMTDFFRKIVLSTKRKAFRFSRMAYRDLYDCQIDLNNEQSIKCHKCILIARSEFFRNMFLGSWLESSLFNIKLPFDADLMQILIDYLYSDEIRMEFVHSTSANLGSSMKSKNEREIEILFNLFVLSDQLLIDRLKVLCEFKLANLVNLKNVVEIVCFAHEYGATQIKDFCMEFVSLNLATLIETKQLESLDFDLLSDLSKFYKNYFSIVSCRMITPYADAGLDTAKIDLIPIELLYDKEFLDSFSSAQILSDAKSAQTIFSTSPTEHESVSMPNTATTGANQQNETNEVNESHGKCAQIGETVLEREESHLKWEKVKKKNRRKASEKEHLDNSSVCNAPATPVGAFFNETDVKKYEEKRQLTESFKKMDINNEWPDLFESKNSQQQKLPAASKQAKKLAKANPVTIQLKSTAPAPTKPFAWGSSNASSATAQSPPPFAQQFSLMDVMNEELEKQNMKKAINGTALKPQNQKKSSSTKQDTNNNNINKPQDEQSPPTSLKAWSNVQQTSNANASSTGSLANIIEMEKRSKEQYIRLRNRPLHAIQLEEKAVQDLRVVYDVDSLTDVSITIEVLDEAEIAGIVPIWKKN